MALFDRALLTAVIQFTNVPDKAGYPLIYHSIRVADMARYCGLDEYCQSIAVLHDVVEDTDITLNAIYKLFGGRVGNGVNALTRRNKKNAILDSWGEPVDETYTQFVHRAIENPDAAKIKMLDNADNMRPDRRIEGLKLVGRYEKALGLCREKVSHSDGGADFLAKFDTLVDWV
jgi:GTP pyrophosphokinase